MSWRCIWVTALASMLFLAAAAPAWPASVRDLHFGEALFHAHQGDYFEALSRLDAELFQHHGLDEPELDSLHHHIGQAEFSVGDFELNYRMHHRAGRAIRAVLEGNVDDAVRNEAAYRLARIHFQKDQPQDALQALDRIHGRVPEQIRSDVEFLRANIYLALDRVPEAIDVLKRLQGAADLSGFSAYNLGIALLRDGRLDEALSQLDSAGQVRGRDAGTASIRDKSNLILGTLLLESAQYGRAQRSLDRVRLEGPFSNSALLRAGWADVSAENYQRALVPWSILVDREITDSAVQEALLAVPYAYSKLNVHGRAALMYGQALESFGAELGRLDASIRSIRQGKFLEALVREEIRQDKNWVIGLRALPEAPETYYLMTLLASHDFQTSLQNFLDLEDLRTRLVSWDGNFDAFEDVIRLRRGYHEPLLPEVDRQFRTLDSQIRLRLEQRDRLEQRLQAMLTAPRPDFLATAAERLDAMRLDDIERRLRGATDPAGLAAMQRVQRLRGILTWQQHTEYHERLTEAHENLHALNVEVEALQQQYRSFVRVRQAATHSYVGYDIPIERLRGRVGNALQKVDQLQRRQGHMLEMLAIRELEIRRERLEGYQVQARFALADSYDRATKAQAGFEERP
ncbi:MAG: tetratricopeptide repeat protein [Pseudomonadales bacterium]